MPRNFSFFRRTGHSGKVRAIQIAQFLGNARVAPTDGYDDDICIYVKIRPPKRYPEHTYVDVMDEPWVLPWVKRHPNIRIISISQAGKDFLEKELNRQDIIFIPENHCNYERAVVPRRAATTVGVIGGPNAFQFDHEKFVEIMASHGLDFIHFRDYDNRQDVIDFYHKIDIQVVWRQWLNFPQLNNPLKLINAMSFGIPTVAYPEVSYKMELDGYFIPVTTIDEMVEQVVRLKNDPAYYDEWRQKGIAKAEEYHIESIAKLYRKLADDNPLIGASPKPEETRGEPPAKTNGDGMRVKIYGELLPKEILIEDADDGLPKVVPVYGLAHFRTSPKRMGMGTAALRAMEMAAERDGKHAVVCFTTDAAIEFYLKAGWLKVGTYEGQHVLASKPLIGVTVREVW
jgi:hypothetical protein